VNPTFRQQLNSYPRPKASIDRELIKRWSKDDRADEVWRKLKKSRPDADAKDFIKAVITARRSARATVNRIYGTFWYRGGQKIEVRGFNATWAAMLPALKKRLGNLSSTGPLDLADIFESIAQELRDLHRFYFGFADQSKFEPSRKDQNGTRVRKLFRLITGNYVAERFGRQFDSECSILTEIAFPRGKPLDRDDAINMRRPTTVLERSKNQRNRSGTFKRKIRS
jgi:hypothetical protein